MALDRTRSDRTIWSGNNVCTATDRLSGESPVLVSYDKIVCKTLVNGFHYSSEAFVELL